MQFFHRATGGPSRLAVLPGTFNPVTVAHLELARAALPLVDEVVFVLPREFPHKVYAGASFADRVQMLEAAARHPRFSIAAVDHGLFVEIAQECRDAYAGDVRVTFLCGRDAAERVAGWDYGDPRAFAGMLRQFDLLVAARNGEYTPPAEFQHAIQSLPLSGNFDCVSATDVRDLIRRGERWEHLVPPVIRPHVASIYSRPRDIT
jgi:nicotinate (nicotinamide) nucleotide adenylyltransferase